VSPQGERYCVLRAVPAGTTPSAVPGSVTPWQGPEVGFGQAWNYSLGLGGAPNPPDTLKDYWISQSQAGAYDDYDSVSSCGLCDVWLHKPGTLERSNPIWWANDALYFHIPSAEPFTRSALQVDGLDAYAAMAGAVAGLQASAGFPALSYDQHVDPATGDLTIHETSPFKTCSPQPAVYPPTKTTCASFTDAVVLKRTIMQTHSGRQVTIVDRWASADGAPHELDAYYDETVYDPNHATVGHEAKWNFSWTGDGFTSYATDTQIPVAGSAGRSVLVKPDGSIGDDGDGTNPIGALTYSREPSELIFRDPVSSTNSVGDWQERYKLSIPATGAQTITQVYSHAFSISELQPLLADATSLVGAPADPVAPSAGDAGAPAAVTPAPAAQPASAPAAVVKCRVPKLKGKTLRTAKRSLRNAHCRLGKLTRNANQRMRPGRVISSKPGAGRVRSAGARIAVTLAKR
jgi:hypothetical protein